ncbi:MAG: histidinol-phosphatase [Clostridia bacterium]|nr:histidinol-phosphatase [Clostridia bacterium]
MIHNYHTHTYRCGHASGKEEEYIKRAIENGIKYMGFSDHAPFVFPDGYESGFRVPFSQAKDYVLELSKLREKYKNEIDLKIGFEMEYYPSHFNKMLQNIIDLGIEYLILGQHYLYEEHPDGVHSNAATDRVEDLQNYVSCVVKAIESGVFTYVAHPDMVRFTGDVEVYQQEIRQICVASRTFDIPLEINFLGIRDNRNYPNEAFWEIAGQEKSPVTFGFDAHNVESAFDGQSLIKAQKLVDKYNLNYIGIPKLRPVFNGVD